MQGQTLSASTGSWAGPTPTFSFQWQRCDSSGGGCSGVGSGGASYTLGAGDVGSTLRVSVTATNKNGSSVATSSPSAVVTAPGGGTTTTTTTGTTTTGTTTTGTTGTTTTVTTTGTSPTGPYTNTSAPTLTGSATVGSTLKISAGTWSPAPSGGYVYAWEHCTPGTWTCANEPTMSTSSTTYVIQPSDVGQVVTVNVAPVDGSGTRLWTQGAISNQTATVGGTTTAVATTTTTATTTTAAATTTTTSSPTGSVLFDGRAKRMTSLYSYETTPENLSTLVSGQSPNVWTGLAFLNNDISLASDSSYGQVYSIRTGYNSHNPYYTPSNGRSSELSVRQTMTLGSWDWYGNAYKVKSGWTQPDWAILYQFGYPTLSSPPLAISADRTSDGVPRFQLFQNAGLLTNNGSGFYAGTQQGDTPIVAIPFDTWVQIIVGVKWETNSTGELRVYYRIPSKNTGWVLAISKSNIPTEQYGTTPAGSCSADYSNCTTVIDHGGLYFGYYGAMPSPFPTNYVSQSGLTRSSDLATAQSTLP